MGDTSSSGNVPERNNPSLTSVRRLRTRAAGLVLSAATAHHTFDSLKLREHYMQRYISPFDVLSHVNNVFDTMGFVGLLALSTTLAASRLRRTDPAIMTAACLQTGTMLNVAMESNVLQPFAAHLPAELVISAVADPIDFGYGAVAALGSAAFLACGYRGASS